MWLCEYFWIILLYGHLVYVLHLKVLAWEICNMKRGFDKKVILKSQRQFMYGSNFYESDFTSKSAAFRCFFLIFFRFSHITGLFPKCSATFNFSLASLKLASFGLFSTCSTVFEFSLGSSKSAAFRCLILERSRISDVQSCAY